MKSIILFVAYSVIQAVFTEAFTTITTTAATNIFSTSSYKATTTVVSAKSSIDCEVDGQSSRRNFVAASSLAFLTAFGGITIEPVLASGGATAGGAYLLSAKQRYNERVAKAVRGLLAAGDAAKNGDTSVAKAYFAGEDVGSWKDLTAAGYLLSNAFRRNSTASPDSLPSVKKYKAFAAEVEVFQKSLKKKGGSGAGDAFTSVEEALEIWLNQIELPTAREL